MHGSYCPYAMLRHAAGPYGSWRLRHPRRPGPPAHLMYYPPLLQQHIRHSHGHGLAAATLLLLLLFLLLGCCCTVRLICSHWLLRLPLHGPRCQQGPPWTWLWAQLQVGQASDALKGTAAAAAAAEAVGGS